MKPATHAYTTIQVRKEINLHIRNFCKKYNVNASAVTELMWVSYISSSQCIKEIMSMNSDAKNYLLSASYDAAMKSMSGSLTV
jgi:hypothetical protein